MDFRQAFYTLLVAILVFWPLIQYSGPDESDTCPFCYDDQFCTTYRNNVTLKSTSFFEYLLIYFNAKPMNYATYNNKSVVIKTLATLGEHVRLDQMSKQVFGNDFSCNDSQTDQIYSEIVLLLNKTPDFITKIKICPNLNDIQILFKGYDFSKCESLIHLWSTLMLNPEPIILQIFRAEDDWPVPIYYGSCNRRVVVEDCGTPLSHYVDKSWKIRVHLVKELIELAMNFTFGYKELALYLTDLTLDNVAVDKQLKIRVIDLEHTIIVKKTDNFGSSSMFHVSQHFNSIGFTYSPIAICSHRFSDHNIYAVCKEFLHSRNSYTENDELGFLKGTPQYILDEYEINKLVHDCVEPGENDRFLVVLNLRDAFSKIIQQYGIQD